MLAQRPLVLNSNRGLSIVELLVGIAVGMFVLAGATMVTANQMSDNRKLLLEAQIQQDMRAAMDIIVRDVRRSGYWSDAYKSVAPASLPLSNPYSSAGILPLGAGVAFAYTTSRDEDNVHAETGVVEANEWNGFKLNSASNAIEVQLGNGNFQQLTDPSVVKITQLLATVTTTPINLPVCGTPPCAMTAPPTALNAACGGMSRVMVRTIDLLMSGEAVHDANVKRSIVGTIRLRNDQVCQ